MLLKSVCFSVREKEHLLLFVFSEKFQGLFERKRQVLKPYFKKAWLLESVVVIDRDPTELHKVGARG